MKTSPLAVCRVMPGINRCPTGFPAIPLFFVLFQFQAKGNYGSEKKFVDKLDTCPGLPLVTMTDIGQVINPHGMD
jgi:hypothetical protein